MAVQYCGSIASCPIISSASSGSGSDPSPGFNYIGVRNKQAWHSNELDSPRDNVVRHVHAKGQPTEQTTLEHYHHLLSKPSTYFKHTYIDMYYIVLLPHNHCIFLYFNYSLDRNLCYFLV